MLFIFRIGEEENVDDEPKEEMISGHSVKNDFSINSESSAKTIEIDEDTYGLWVGSNNSDLNGSLDFYVSQFIALIQKRFIHTIRNKILIVSQILIPLVILIINLVYLKYAPIKAEDSPPLTIGLSPYSSNTLPYQIIATNDSDKDLVLQNLAKVFKHQLKNLKNTKYLDLKDNQTQPLCANQRHDIDDFLGCMSRIDLNNAVDRFLVAETFSYKDKKILVTAHFNNQPFHIPPLTLNLVSNALYQFFTNTNNLITVINEPLPRSIYDQGRDLHLKNGTGNHLIPKQFLSI